MLFANVIFVLGLRRMTFSYYQRIGVRPTGEAGECQRFKSENSIKHYFSVAIRKCVFFLYLNDDSLCSVRSEAWWCNGERISVSLFLYLYSLERMERSELLQKSNKLFSRRWANIPSRKEYPCFV